MVALRTPVSLVAVLILPVARALPVKPSGASADPSAQPRAEGGDQATFLASIALPDNAVEVSSVSPAAEGARDEVQREVNAVNEALQSVGSSLQFDPDLLASKVGAGYGPDDALQDSEAAVTEAAQAEIGRAFRIAFKPIFKEVSDSAELRAFIDTEILRHKDDAIDQAAARPRPAP